MKKYLKMPWAVRLATLFAMIPALFLGGCAQQTKCEKSIDTAMGTVISQTVYVTGNSPTATNGKTDEKVTDVADTQTTSRVIAQKVPCVKQGSKRDRYLHCSPQWLGVWLTR